MSIADQITRLQGVKSDILTSIESKGVDVPASSMLSDAPSLIDSISTLDSSVITNPYSVSTAYPKGTLVMNNGYLYSALDDMEPGEWDETKWLKTNVAASIPTKTSQLQNDSGYITGVLVGDGIYYTSDGKLTTTEPEGNFIDITNEWEFLNGFRLQYNGSEPGPDNEFKVLYSPISDTVLFKNDMRINRTSSIDTTSWNRFLYYKGDRFYDTYNAPTPDLRPTLGITSTIGGMIYVPGSYAIGSSAQVLCTMQYLGDNVVPDPKDAALGFKLFYSNNITCYGILATNLVLKVHKKV